MTVIVAASMLLLARRRWGSLAVLVGSAAGSGLLSSFLKVAVHRSRPTPATTLVTAAGYAFPSGHATQSIATYAALATVASCTLQRRADRAVLWSGTWLVAVGIGISRVYLGVHWASDVVAGWVLAGAWLVVLTATIHWREYQPNPKASRPPSSDSSQPA